MGDMLVVDRLHPYGLPDTSNRGVPDAIRICILLSYRLVTIRCRVPHFYQQLLISRLEIMCDVETEWSISTRM